jgi:hypothetical protein
MCPKKGQQKHGRIWSSVPKGKRMAKKKFKEVSQVCPNKKKGAKKSLKEVLLSLPRKQSQKSAQKKFKRSLFESAPKRMSEKVPKKSLKCAQTGKNSVQEKSSHPISSPISCSDPQFHNINPQFWELHG